MPAKKQESPSKVSSQQKAEAKVKQAASKKSRNVLYVAIGIVVLAAVAILVLTQSGSIQTTVPFSTFKTNLDAAPNISILVDYQNVTQFSSEESCVTYIVEVLSNNRAPNTIDFYETNATSCTYSPNGLGHEVTPLNTTAANCISQANSEPGLVLSYSDINSTTINPQRMFVYGNAAYYAQCPIAVDLN